MTPVISPRSTLLIFVVCLALLLVPHADRAQVGSAPRPLIDCPPCDDHNDCTVDRCDTTTGTCRYEPLDCDDHNPCTEDVCYQPPGQVGECGHLILPGGTLCSDGNPCTTGDACDGTYPGACVGVTQPAGTSCNDGNACTIGDTCGESGDCAGTALPPGTACDDGSLCTAGDLCTEMAGGSVVCSGTLRSCDDGDACTVDICNPSTGECAVNPLDCDDGNVCTDDGCDPATGCVRTPASAPCSDGDLCTTGETCIDGNCVGGTGCGEGSECTQVFCNPERGCEYFDLSGGSCDEDNPCAISSCVRGYCEPQLLLDGEPCDDGNPCTTVDTCMNGYCQGTEPPNCEDGLACTRDECSPLIGCFHEEITDPCEDGNACSDFGTYGCGPDGSLVCYDGPDISDCNPDDSCLNWYCDPAQGCVYEPVDCDDGDPCTVDRCFPSVGCDNLLESEGPCDDGDPCTVEDSCGPIPGGWGCSGTPRCDDGNPCTDDACDDSGACSHTFNDGPCDDGDNCTSIDTCAGGVCLGTGPLDCSDGNPCTDDFCDASGSCGHAANTSPCDDGNACTLDDACADGVCQSTRPLNCDDLDGCTLDSCDPAAGCIHVTDPSLPDTDFDGVPDPCDNCPSIPNPDQNPCVCQTCGTEGLTISFKSPEGKGSGLVRWTTNIEIDVRGFNVVVISNKGVRTQQNDVLIPCLECTTGQGASYAFIIPKHKNGRNIYVELLRIDGTVDLFGPARKE